MLNEHGVSIHFTDYMRGSGMSALVLAHWKSVDNAVECVSFIHNPLRINLLQGHTQPHHPVYTLVASFHTL